MFFFKQLLCRHKQLKYLGLFHFTEYIGDGVSEYKYSFVEWGCPKCRKLIRREYIDIDKGEDDEYI